MKITIDRIKIVRFKKVRNLTIDLNGRSAKVTGQNGTGKTTIIDAIHWLLTGTDSGHKTKFGIFEIDRKGDQIDHQDASVTMVLSRFGQLTEKIEIKKEYKQKWTRKRGQVEKVRSNDTTKHYWAGVPVLKKDFDAKLLKLASPEKIRCLIDAHYFLSRTKPGDRRNILLSMVDPESIRIEKPPILNDYTLAEARKLLSVRKKELSGKLETIPSRIDELNKMLPVEFDMETGAAKLEKINKEIRVVEADLKEISGRIINCELNQRLFRTQNSIDEIKTAVREEHEYNLKRYQDELQSYNYRLNWMTEQEKVIKAKIETAKLTLLSNQGQRDILKETWKTIKKEVFSHKAICITCGQKIPEDDIAKQEAEFLMYRKARLDGINSKGQTLFNQYKEIEKEINDMETSLKQLLQEKGVFIENSNKTKRYIENTRGIIEEKEKKAAKDLYARKAALENELSDMEKEISEKRIGLEKRLHELFYERKCIPNLSHIDDIKEKIGERNTELKKAAHKYEETEQILMDLENYSMQRSKIIEEKVNLKFNSVKWRLFEHQKNGIVKEICEPMMNGIYYNQDLNTGAKINAGIDAIITLSQEYGLQLPVLVDNAESVTTWQAFNGQMIRMIADETKKELTIQIE